MSPKEELEKLHAEQKRIETRIAEIYKASVDAPEDQKVTDDFFAQMLSEPPKGFIEFPITVTGIAVRQNNDPVDRRNGESTKQGTWVAVRPANDESTYLGVYLGRIALSHSASHNKQTGVLAFGFGMFNPAIWVPDLKRIVFGAESWWGVIKGPDDLKKITNQDIQNVWYVRALTEVSEKVDAPAGDGNELIS